MKDNYRDIDRLDFLRNDQNSEYYKDVQHSVVSHYEQEPYYRTKWYKREVKKPYNDVEEYTETITKTRPKIVYKQEQYKENEQYLKKAAYTTQEDHGHWGLVPRFWGIKIGEKEWISDIKIVHHPAEYGIRKVTKTRDVPELTIETYNDEITKQRIVTKYKSEKEWDYKEVRDFRNKPVYKTITNRELDQEKYQNELAELQHKLAANVQDATSIMDDIPANQGDAIKENIQHDICPEVRDLLRGWQNAELSQYFSNNPGNSLQVLGIEAIGDIVEAVDLI